MNMTETRVSVGSSSTQGKRETRLLTRLPENKGSEESSLSGGCGSPGNREQGTGLSSAFVLKGKVSVLGPNDCEYRSHP